MKSARSALLPGLLAVAAAAGCDGSPTRVTHPALEIATASLPQAVRGQLYAEPIYAEGGDGAYFWDIVAGSLPTGLDLGVDDQSVDHAIITGIPEEVQTAVFTVQLRSGDGQSVTREFSLTVVHEPAPLVVHTQRLPPALVGGPYDFQLQANGGDEQRYDWALAEGTLPAGLELTQAGRIRGTPTTVQAAAFVIEVSSGGLTTRWSFELRVVPHDTDAFRITVHPVVDIPAALQPHIDAAVAAWEAAITGNLTPVEVPRVFLDGDDCAGFGLQANGTSVDDVLVLVSITEIDGAGGVLGRAGPCGVRTSSLLPFVGVVGLDVDDLMPLVGTDRLTNIITHEMAHVFRYGTLWEELGLIQGAGGTDPRFTGQRATAEFQALGGTGSVPLETQGGEGTRDGHWRKSVFNVELMTGFAEPVGVHQPISRVTIAQWQDLGYTVNMAAAETFALSGGAGGTHAYRIHELLHAHDDIYRGRVRVLGEDGRSTLLRPER